MSGGLVGKWTALSRGSTLNFSRTMYSEKKKCPSLNFIPYSRTMSLEDNPSDVVSATLQNEECCYLMIVSIVEIA
jgi:hypothetical protein